VRAFDNAGAGAAGPVDRARLRRLLPDPELVRRRAAGETLRWLVCDYGVAHTTVGDRRLSARRRHQEHDKPSLRRSVVAPAKP
jgi:hypothetical protein